ncbi:MAG: CDP-alcohol phosphatidyltransferase family protein [Chloroflexi bacterium]|nr:MAG: CDP-alcohol phosphatidyltransferase family protein [Chloroflexota bacterium]
MQSCGRGWAPRVTRRPSATRGARWRHRLSRSMRRRAAPLSRARWRRCMFTTRFEAWVRRHAERLMSALGRLPVTPNQITVVGTALTFLAAVLIAAGQLLPAGIVLAFAGTFDILDGALARSTRRSYPYGAFLDSTLDRYSEGATYIGLIAYFVAAGGPLQRWLVLAAGAALAGSFLVSYVRARAQSLGFTCETGLFARPERIVVTVVGLVLGGYIPLVLYLVVFLLAFLTNLTALQRIREVWLQGRAQRLARERESKAVTGGQPVKP